VFTFDKYIRRIIAALALIGVAVLSSCVKNDLPYPWILPNVLDVEVVSVDDDGHELLASPVAVDSASRTIVINLTEWADIHRVEIKKLDLSDGSECLNPQIFDNPLDLSEPIEVYFRMYDREFTWTISAVQEIERYFNVASQIGTARIDVDNHTVSALIPMAQSLSSVLVRSLKLAGPLATYSPVLAGERVDFSLPVSVIVTEFGRDTEWTVTVEQTEVNVELTKVDAWTNVAWLYADAEIGKDNGFEYRRVSDETWSAVPDEWVTENGGSFSARLIHLEPMTDYVARATSDDEHSAEIEFTTEADVQLPNADFTQWWLNGKVWNPWEAGGEATFWDTANRGATTLGQSNTTPIEDITSPTGYAGVKLETKFVGVSVLGKLASGNLFAGAFVGIDGTDGVLDFGRPFVNRPTRLRARIKYSPVPIDKASSVNPDFSYMKGDIDTCIVWCALGDWDEPYRIRTKKSDRRLFNPSDPGVIAYGDYQTEKLIEDYIEIEVPLKYNDTSRVPKYLLITAAASKYGDYFTGGSGSVLCIKKCWLEYDY